MVHLVKDLDLEALALCAQAPRPSFPAPLADGEVRLDLQLHWPDGEVTHAGVTQMHKCDIYCISALTLFNGEVTCGLDSTVVCRTAG